MNTTLKTAAFAGGLALAFTAAYGIGHATGSDPQPGSGHSTHGPAATPTPAQAASGPGGLQVSDRGYTLALDRPFVPTGTASDLRFRILGPDGKPVTAYRNAHDKELHLIVASRDLTSFQHLHPARAADGTWSTEASLPTAGTYRVFADFAPAATAEGLTLGADLHASGEFRPASLPETGRTVTVDGYTVTLAGDLTPGRATTLTLNVAKDGRPVTDLQPYLAAYGHLVALRAGDLAYLHVHPDGAPGDGTTTPGPGITFTTTAPSDGNYRLFLDFQHNGVVRTAAFTVTTAGSPATPSPTATPDGHTGAHQH